MSDYISLVARIRYHIEKAKFCGLGDHEATKLLTEAADAIEQLSNAGSAYGRGWTLGYDAGREENKHRLIPVSERLPDTDGDYLVWFYDARCWKVAVYSKHTAKERHVWWFAGIDRTKFVTHWMPLPQPAEEE